jgi:hypothetical protein
MPKAWVRAEANCGGGATGCWPLGGRNALGGVAPPKASPCAGIPTPDCGRGACGTPTLLAGRAGGGASTWSAANIITVLAGARAGWAGAGKAVKRFPHLVHCTGAPPGGMSVSST